ncbi:similar to An02g13130 [Aspergillus luchuensis]|uniref:Similar to An02g13130 n=1 Tax=Aspergillus kawachii TaxID=1069201 RepID=A0A146FDJ6_ASPKA|nr:similar to An02g13130 [Aspergillus luchuensis]
MAPHYMVLDQRAIDHHIMKRDLSVTHAQAVTLGVMAAYVVVIALLWNLPYVRWSLWPFKMLVIAFHEFGHAITACCTGGRVKSISLDPHEGGVTHMQGGMSAVTLPAGYLGSSIIGSLLIFAGFDIVASKVASIVLGCDDLILRKVNTSDASQFAKRYGGSSQCWGVIWSFISLAFIAIAIIAAIAAFRESFSEQEKDSQHFIPTR